MNRKRLSFPASLCAMLAVFVTAGSLKAQLGQPPRKLPFRATQDGSVDFRDLLKLARQAPTKNRISDAELQEIKDSHAVKYGPGFIATNEPVMPARGDYYANSTLLTDGVNHTVLPNSAVIYLPEKYRDRKIEEPKGKLILWPDFLKENRKWIRTQEVTLETAVGNDPLPEEKMKAFSLAEFVIVGVLSGSPISVLPARKKEDSAADTSVKAHSNGKSGATAPVTTSRYRNNSK